MDFDVIGFGRLGDKDVGKENGDGEDDDDDDHALPEPTLGLPHPCNAAVFLFLGAQRGASMMMVVRHKLLEDGVEEGGEGDEDASASEPEGGGGTDAAVARLHLVGLHIDNVILLEIIIRGVDQIGVVQVEGVDLLLAGGIFTNQFYVGTHTIDSEVASLS